MLKRYAFPFFIGISCLHLLAILMGWEAIRFSTKPLLIPVLMLAVYSQTPTSTQRTLVLVALFFSFLGDVFLLLEYANPLLFIAGLVCFLTTHILYIVYFGRLRPIKESLLKRYPWILVLILAYGIGLVYFLFPTLGDLTLPVIVYAIIICTMLGTSLHIFKRVNPSAGNLFVGGALLFVLSDSLLAVNKFSTTFPYAGVLIMLTYCAAQYFIAKGFVAAKRAN